MTETVHIDPRDSNVDRMVQSLAEMLREAGPTDSVTIDRDTMRAIIGAYKLATSALDDVGAAIVDYREQLDGDTGLLGDVLRRHGIALPDGVA